MKRGYDYRFSQVPTATIPRSVFNRNHQYKSTFNAGELIPFYVDEILPGDTFSTKLSVFCRLATPIAALMDNMHLDIHYFFVPNRLVWNNWVKFMGEKDNLGDTTTYTIPTVSVVVASKSLFDYMGLPISASSQTFNALPFRAYNLIYDTWYRDENLITAVDFPRGDGPDSSGYYQVRYRGKRHDYFTSCLPWPQKGTGVMLPLGTSATVKSSASPLLSGAQNPLLAKKAADGGALTLSKPLEISTGAKVGVAGGATWTGGSSPEPLYLSNLYADLSTATASTINSLRQAFQVQHLMERDARGGTRYTEILKSHFGVESPDSRLQRPEYLGGGTVDVLINPVYQTSNSPSAAQTGTSAYTPQGNVAAYGIAAKRGIGFTKSFVEHGFVIGIASARADLSYQQGINRMWSRQTKYDYFWPALAHLGEQVVYNKEIYFAGSANDDAVFGYQERWAEYRYKPSLVTGLFRSGVTGTLDFWHLAQKFNVCPQLGQTFIEENPPMARIKAVQDSPDFLFDSYIECKCARPMPLYSVPGLIDHF